VSAKDRRAGYQQGINDAFLAIQGSIHLRNALDRVLQLADGIGPMPEDCAIESFKRNRGLDAPINHTHDAPLEPNDPTFCVACLYGVAGPS
jgi:hypothetical protein